MRPQAKVLIVLALFCASATLGAPGEQWHGVAKAPRVGLPDVAIDLGYPGPYVPTNNFPIELHAVAVQRFNGYIGYHFAVGRNQTNDEPVVARAFLQPNQGWSFTTWAGMGVQSADLMPQRELVIEWRNNSMQQIAEKSVGVLPWSFRGAAGLQIEVTDRDAPVRYADLRVIALPVTALSDQAQWYAGFDRVIVPVALWLRLPGPVREAIFSSARPVVFVGFPERGQTLDRLDRAMLPVEFEPGPAAFVPPWPYPGNHGPTLSLPMSWKPKPSSFTAGRPELPALVRNQTALWVPDPELLVERIPSMLARVSARGEGDVSRAKPSLREFAGEYRALVGAAGVVLLMIAGWLTLRVKPKVTVAAAVLAGSVALLGMREWIRPERPTIIRDEIDSLENGVSLRQVMETEYGAAPLAPPRAAAAHGVTRVDARVARTAVFGQGFGSGPEIRSSVTPPGLGARSARNEGWVLTQWRFQRRELGNSPQVRVVSREPGRLVIDFESPVPVRFATAGWVVGGKRYYGAAKLPAEARRERVVIGTEILWTQFDMLPYLGPFELGMEPFEYFRSFDTVVHLVSKDGGAETVLRWSEPFREDPKQFRGYEMSAAMIAAGDRAFICSFAIPPRGIPARPAISIDLPDLPLSRLEIATEHGSFEMRREKDLEFGWHRYVPSEEATPSLRGGDIVRLRGEFSRPLSLPDLGNTTAGLSIQEKTP